MKKYKKVENKQTTTNFTAISKSKEKVRYWKLDISYDYFRLSITFITRIKMASLNEDRNHQKQDNSSENLSNRFRKETESQNPPAPTYRNAREYAQALRPWLWQYYSSYAMHSFAANCAMQMQAMSQFAYTNSLNNNYCSAAPSTYLRSRNDPYASRRPHTQVNGAAAQTNQQNAQERQGAGDQSQETQGRFSL